MDSYNFQLSLTENVAFWFLWLLTAIICTYAAVYAIRRADQILGFIPVFCMAFGYFYVLQAAVVATTLSHKLEPWMLTLGQALALSCLLGTLVGYFLGCRSYRPSHSAPPYTYKSRNVWYAGVSLMLIGIIGQISYFSFSYSEGVDSTLSAYWYLLYHLFYPGLALCVRQYASSREFRTPACLLLLIILSVAYLYYWVSLVRRGPIFPYFIAVAYTYYLTTRRVNRPVLVGGLVSVGLLMLFFVLIRDYHHEQGSWRPDQLERVTVQDVMFKKAQVEGDNEYLYHCGYSATTYELDRFQYGTGYLNLSIHWIPRQLWPDKPTLLDQGWFSRVQGYEMEQVVGWRMTPGAATSGVAETYQQFSWLVPFFWLGLGWVIGRSYAYAYFRPTIARQTLYVGLISVTHWLISQGFVASFVPVMIYTIVPLTLLYFFRVPKPPDSRSRTRRL